MREAGYSERGFTIVELLIVVVVIAILASITVVAFSGIQQKSRDTSRTSAISQIRKGLEAYRIQCGVYPAHIGTLTNAPAGFSGIWGSGYSYSVDTAGNWLKNLTRSCSGVDGEGPVKSIPVDPTNNNTYYFTYWASAGYGACTDQPFYVLSVIYENSANVPNDSRSLNCTGNGFGANWVATPTTGGYRAVFSNTRTP